jgi:hypothetical protein
MSIRGHPSLRNGLERSGKSLDNTESVKWSVWANSTNSTRRWPHIGHVVVVIVITRRIEDFALEGDGILEGTSKDDWGGFGLLDLDARIVTSAP